MKITAFLPESFNFPLPTSLDFVIDMVSQQGNSIEHHEPAEPFSTNVQAEFRTIDAGEDLRTPLPEFQLFLALLIQFAEPITALVIYPFVNQFVRDIGITKGDVSKTGYYAGIIVILLLLFLVVNA